ncbi:hypothetical protein MRX96_042779 [Rhipicephalus microplus]
MRGSRTPLATLVPSVPPPAASDQMSDSAPAELRSAAAFPPVTSHPCSSSSEERPLVPAIMAAQTNLSVRENCFFFKEPNGDLCLDNLIDAVERTAGDDSVHNFQHTGGSGFLMCTRTAVDEGFIVNNVKVAVVTVRPPITFAMCFDTPHASATNP